MHIFGRCVRIDGNSHAEAHADKREKSDEEFQKRPYRCWLHVLIIAYTYPMRLAIVVFFLCLVPSFAFALPRAGFPDASVWLSNTAPKHGEKIRMYTVVYNGTGESVDGTLTFLVDGKEHASQEISLATQSSKVVSAEWQATAGNHTFGARFGSEDSAVSEAVTASTQVSVAEPPPPTALQKTAEQTSSVVNSIASTSVPVVTNIASAIFEKTEAVRNAGIEYLESKLDAEPASAATIAGTSTAPIVARNNTSATGFGTSSDGVTAEPSAPSKLHSAGQTAASAALFTLKSAYLFYPIFGFLFFFLLYRAYRLFRRPDY